MTQAQNSSQATPSVPLSAAAKGGQQQMGGAGQKKGGSGDLPLVRNESCSWNPVGASGVLLR